MADPGSMAVLFFSPCQLFFALFLLSAITQNRENRKLLVFHIFENLKNDVFRPWRLRRTLGESVDDSVCSRIVRENLSRIGRKTVKMYSHTPKILTFAAVSDTELNSPSQCQPSVKAIASLVDSSNLTRFLDIYFNDKCFLCCVSFLKRKPFTEKIANRKRFGICTWLFVDKNCV